MPYNTCILPWVFVNGVPFFLEHNRGLSTWLVFHQVERRFHGWESNLQPLRSVWVPLHYHLAVLGHLGLVNGAPCALITKTKKQ